MPPVLIESLNRLSSSTQENTADVDEDDTEVDEEVLVAAETLEIGREKAMFGDATSLSLSLSPTAKSAEKLANACESDRDRGGL